jgi:exodeoxyribonuclease VII large subunit
MNMPDEKIYTVTAITRLIKYTLEETFPSIWVEGEISNYILHTSGHRYLTLKDDNASLRLTIWRSLGQYLKFEPENGMKVRAFGDVTVYEKGGSYQLNVRKLLPVGVGELEVAFRQLYEKLAREGLFEESRKKPLPAYPERIGIVTSPTGAAIRDIAQISRRRNNTIQLILFPAIVQGDEAARSIVSGIEYFNQRADIDIIVVGRGGGSLEDLWAFNEEAVVRAVADSKIPIVSGVGHEIDTTLTDLAADLRAPTPSAAAELVVWSKSEMKKEISGLVGNLDYLITAGIGDLREKVIHYITRPVFMRPEALVAERLQFLDTAVRLLDNAGKNVLEKYRNRVSLNLSRLESLSPLAILHRGYAVIRSAEEKITIRAVADIKAGDRVETILQDGRFFSTIEEIIAGESPYGRREKEV